MLTGTCDLCQETAPFADHLAGLTVRCTKCGQGRVHVDAATGITASVPPITEKGSSEPSDTAVTEQRPPAPNGSTDVDRPAPGTCPKCGSPSFRQLKAKRGKTLLSDRECKECGTSYLTVRAPISSAVRPALYVSGSLLILGGVAAGLLHLANVQGPAGRGVVSFPLYTVLFSVLLGFRVLSMPHQTQQLREKRLSDYRASAPPGAPPPVDLPRPPDMVFLSNIFGALALTSPLVSALLLVLAFGPAAIVCGIIAVSQGHIKGLIGAALGIAGLVVWGWVFLFVFRSVFQ